MTAHSMATVSAVQRGDALYAFHLGVFENKLWYSKYVKDGDAWAWADPVDCVSGMQGRPSAVLYGDRILIVHNDSGNRGILCYDAIRADDKREGDKELFTDAMSYWPSAVVFKDKRYVFFQSRNSGELHYRVFDGNDWSEDRRAGEHAAPTGSPSAVVSDGKLFVFFEGFGSTGALWWTELAGTDGTWIEPRQVPNTSTTGEPSAVAYQDKLYVFHAGNGNDKHNIWCKVYYKGMWTADCQIPEVDILGIQVQLCLEISSSALTLRTMARGRYGASLVLLLWENMTPHPSTHRTALIVEVE